MAQRQTVNSIVHGDYVVTMDCESRVVRDGAVAIDSGIIAAVGSAEDIREKFQSDTEIDGTNQIVMPGLINGHTHAAMSLLRGYAYDIPLMEWLQEYINPIEAFAVDEEYVRVGTALACWEMLLGGTTTFVDMYFFHEIAAQVADEIGMRALISATVVDQPRNDAVDIDDSFEQARQFVEGWKNRKSTVEPILGGHAIYTLKNEHLLRLRDMAESLEVPIHIHVSESEFELQFSNELYGTTPIKHFQEIGLLDYPVIAAHVVWPTTEEMGILKQYGVGVIHNATCNAKIASGTAPIVEMLANDIKVGLGTDGVASSNNLDLWEEMRVASLLQRARSMDSTDLPAREMLRLATSGGAAALGLDHKIGHLAEGMEADMIQVSIDAAHHLPLYDVESHVAYCTKSGDVSNVFVQGRHVVQDRQVMTIEIEALNSAIQGVANRISSFNRTGSP
ncbi:MAG: amidohydrolase [Gammaproteobacteria bacterium]|nr:amidohydrolase [Gammaproteobacteria bacterium]